MHFYALFLVVGTAVTTFLCVGAAVALALMTIAAIAPNPGGVGVYLLTNWGIQVSVTSPLHYIYSKDDLCHLTSMQ